MKKILFLSLILYFCYSVVLIIFSNKGFPESLINPSLFPYLADKPVSEDSYYMLTIAENMANGNGLTYNYNMPSTGIQPLVTFIYALIIKILYTFNFDKWDIIRAVYLFNFSLIFLFFLILNKIKEILFGENYEITVMLLFIVLFNNGVFRNFVYGLETGLYLLLFSVTVLYSIHFFQNEINLKGEIILGLLFGLTILARIDFLIILFVWGLINIIKGNLKLKSVFISSLVSLIIVAPWFYYVYSVTGSIIPSSGSAQSKFISTSSLLERSLSLFSGIIDHLTPWLYNAGLIKIALLAFIILLGLVFYKFKLNKSILKRFKGKEFYQFNIWLISTLPILLVYFLFFWAFHFYNRYFSVLLIFTLPLLSFYIQNKLTSKAIRYIFFAFMMISFYAQSYYAFHTKRVTNPHTVTANYIQQNIPTEAKIGCFQSGVTGYFFKNVINLDGKVNSKAVLYSRQHKLHEYIEEEKIDYLIDWEGYIYPNIDSVYLHENYSFVTKLNNNLNNEVTVCYVRKNISGDN